MPVYDYECPEGHQFEKIIPYSEMESKQPCPECKQPASRIMSVGKTGISFRFNYFGS